MGGNGATLMTLHLAQLKKSIHFHAGFISYQVISDLRYF